MTFIILNRIVIIFILFICINKIHFRAFSVILIEQMEVVWIQNITYT